MPSPTEAASEYNLRRGRSRSRSRSRARSKSPSRKAKKSPSPSRRVEKVNSSPTRKTSQVISKKADVSPSRQAKVSEQKTVILSSQDQKTTTTAYRSVSSTSEKSYSTGTRHSARIAEKVLKQESGSGDHSTTTSVNAKPDFFSTKQKETGHGYAPFLFLLFFPCLTISLLYVCTKDSCSASRFLKVHQLIPKDINMIKSYFDVKVTLALLGFITFQVFLSLFPITRLYTGPSIKGSKSDYRLNGFFATFVTAVMFVLMWWFKCGLSFIYQKFTQFAVNALLFSLIGGVLLYIKGRNVKASQRSDEGNTGYIIHDYAMGREINPKFGSLDLKTTSLRIAMISLMVIGWSFTLVAYDRDNKIDLPLFFVNLQITLSCLDYSYNERMILTTPIVQLEGFGALAMLLDFFVVPFFHTLPIRYLLEHPQKIHHVWLGVFAVVYFVGFYIRHAADKQKFKFRVNPHDPSLSKLESMPTIGGRRLLVSGWWGLVRHPNYIGEILMTAVIALTCGRDVFLPYLPAIFTIALLMHRTQLDSKRCRQKHGPAWERYCQRVKYNLVPYVY